MSFKSYLLISILGALFTGCSVTGEPVPKSEIQYDLNKTVNISEIEQLELLQSSVKRVTGANLKVDQANNKICIEKSEDLMWGIDPKKRYFTAKYWICYHLDKKGNIRAEKDSYRYNDQYVKPGRCNESFWSSHTDLINIWRSNNKIFETYSKDKEQYTLFKENLKNSVNQFNFDRKIVVDTNGFKIPKEIIKLVKTNAKIDKFSLNNSVYYYLDYSKQNIAFEEWLKTKNAIVYANNPWSSYLGRYYLNDEPGRIYRKYSEIKFSDNKSQITFNIEQLLFNYGYNPIFIKDKNLRISGKLSKLYNENTLSIDLFNNSNKTAKIEDITLYYGDNVKQFTYSIQLPPHSKKTIHINERLHGTDILIDVKKHKSYKFGLAIEYKVNGNTESLYKAEMRDYEATLK